MTAPWLIDCDPGLGLPLADVDDALAIAHLFAWNVPIAGLTTVYGNASLAATTRAARALAGRFGLAVHPGAAHVGDDLRPLHTTELNFALDEAAAARVLPHVDLLCPMAPCRRVLFGAAELATAPAWLRDGCRNWRLTSPLRTGRFAFHPWDLLPAVAITHPGAVESFAATVTLDSRPGYRGYVRFQPGTTRVITEVRDVTARWLEGAQRLA